MLKDTIAITLGYLFVVAFMGGMYYVNWTIHHRKPYRRTAFIVYALLSTVVIVGIWRWLNATN